MRIASIGAGRIGGNCARQAIKAGHEVVLSFSRDPSSLEALAAELGPSASAATPSEAVSGADLVIVSVPWGTLEEAIER